MTNRYSDAPLSLSLSETYESPEEFCPHCGALDSHEDLGDVPVQYRCVNCGEGFEVPEEDF